RIPPRMPGALLMNSFFMVAAAIVLGVGAHSGQPKPTLSLIALVMAAQVVIGLLFMLLALIWEKSLFRPGSLMGIFVHLAIAGGLVYTLIRALPVLQNQPPPQ
ncbi:MAG TPA: hypothetical protein VI643_00280, partial [Planctomycetota bacterium]|nr:hypothetical protein [Planctomycetota bacterium]